MKLVAFFLGLFFVCLITTAGILPVVTAQPQSQIVSPGGTAAFVVGSTNATGYQWRFNGADMPSGTNVTLEVVNAQSTNVGYYMAVVKNDTGWTPSQMAYLSVIAGSGGQVPFSNDGDSNAQARYQAIACQPAPNMPINDGTAQLVAGPELDQMTTVGTSYAVVDGYFYRPPFPPRTVPIVAAGGNVYYRVDIAYPTPCGSFKQPSSTLKLVAGGDGYPVPSATELRFPGWIEWPETIYPYYAGSATNRICVPGENVEIALWFYSTASKDDIQWRKDGETFLGETTSTNYTNPFSQCFTWLRITNLQPADVGNYDFSAVSRYESLTNLRLGLKFTLTLQLTNGEGVFRSPRVTGGSFVSELEGAPTRQYAIQWSTNLGTWTHLQVVSNATGIVTFSNMLSSDAIRFYRAMLLP